MRPALIAALALWLLLGVGGKVLRYGSDQEPAAPRAERLVREFLGARGWTFAERKPLTGAGFYVVQSFVKAGCSRPLQVVILGASDDAADVVVDRLGPDTAFLSDGRFTRRPQWTAVMSQAVRAGTSLSLGQAAPTLAVSPAPIASDSSSCVSPGPDEWASMAKQ